MGKGGGAPQQQDPMKIAEAQTQSNIDTAKAQAALNNVNQFTPYGSLTYTKGPEVDGVPTYTATQSLNDYGKWVQNQGTMALDRASNLSANPLDFSGAPGVNRPDLISNISANDYSADRQRVEDALMQRMNPQIERDRAAQEADLLNRGIRMGSEAYSAAQQDFGRNVNDARLSAILGAGQEQNRLQQLAIQGASFDNSARQQDYGNQVDMRNRFINEALTARNQGLNENLSILTGSQVQPSYVGTPQTGVGGTDVSGIYQNDYANKYNAWQQQQQQAQNMWGGLFGLGANALMAFSDKRLKDDIEPTGEKIADVPVVTWEWKDTGEKGTGVIAQDVEKKHPELVDKTHPSGYRRVDYGGLMQLGMSAKEAA